MGQHLNPGFHKIQMLRFIQSKDCGADMKGCCAESHEENGTFTFMYMNPIDVGYFYVPHVLVHMQLCWPVMKQH